MKFILENMEHFLAIALGAMGVTLLVILIIEIITTGMEASDVPPTVALCGLIFILLLSAITMWKSDTIESSRRIEPEIKITEFRGDTITSDTIFIYKRPK